MYGNYPTYPNNGYNFDGAAPRQMQRLNVIQQIQPAYQPPLSMQQPAVLNGRAVTSIEEARAVQTPFDGTSIYMPSANEGKIYVKYLDLNGMPVFQTYVIEQAPQQPLYAQRNELEELRKRVERLELGGNADVQSNATNANTNEQQQSNGNA